MYESMSYTGFDQAEYAINVLGIAPQEYVNTCSTRRLLLHMSAFIDRYYLLWIPL